MDKKFFEEMKKIYEFNIDIFNMLSPPEKVKYMFNYFQWKQIEANELGDMKLSENFYKCKNEIQKCADPYYVKKILKVKNLTKDLQNKFIESTIKKFNIELDFIQEN